MISLQKYAVPAVFALFAGIIFSCDRSGTYRKTLDDATFEAVLVDALLAEAYLQEEATYKRFNAASLMNREIYPYIYERHGVDSADFISTYDYYLRHPDEFKPLLDRVHDTLNVILQTAPKPAAELPPPPPPDRIDSDSLLSEDAMNRYKLLQKIKEAQQSESKKSD